MKRYVKEIYNDMKQKLVELGHERNCLYTKSLMQMDKILTMAQRGEITDKEAVSAIINCYDEKYYSIY